MLDFCGGVTATVSTFGSPNASWAIRSRAVTASSFVSGVDLHAERSR
jgi:hypothetical protein